MGKLVRKSKIKNQKSKVKNQKSKIKTMDNVSPKQTAEVTQLLIAYQAGNRDVLDALLPLVYAELRRLAAHYLKNERQGHTLQPTALVHEAFLRLVDQNVQWQNRAHFFAMAANLMRRILVDYARTVQAEKRGGAAEKISLEEAFVFAREKPAEMIALDEALKKLAEIDPRRCQVVELRFFGGLNNEEIAEVLGIHSNTVLRDWNLARAWLRTQI
jgi:RNA polymerase sigma factor (TIGR02999 family)